MLEQLWNLLLNNVFYPIASAASGFWTNAVIPFWNSISGWISARIPALEKFSDFCMSFFKAKYSLRVASFGIMLIILIVYVPVSLVLAKGRKPERRKRK